MFCIVAIPFQHHWQNLKWEGGFETRDKEKMTRTNRTIQAISPRPNAKSTGMQASKSRP